MTSSQLTPTPIVDKNGKHTTVHKLAADVAKSNVNFPAPQAAKAPQKATAPSPAKEYADRLEKIAASNKEWREVGELSDKDRGELATGAFTAMAWIMGISAKSFDVSDQKDLADEIQWLSECDDFSPVILADRFGAVHSVIRNQTEGNLEEDDQVEINFDGEDTSDWESSHISPKDFTLIINAAITLSSLDLRARNDAPEHGDARFLAHLYMSATNTINYRQDDDPDTVSMIKLVDEFPERSELIREGIDDGLHAEGIRAVIQGEVHRGLAEGVL